MRGAVVSLIGLLITIVSLPARADIVGSATVIDGDTLEINGQQIDLYGIDSPEHWQTCERKGILIYCGFVATWKLETLVQGKEVSCGEGHRSGSGSISAHCKVGELDLSAAMIEAGLAITSAKEGEEYLAQQDEAKKAHRGLWDGRFVEPWKWRHGLRTYSAGRKVVPPQDGKKQEE